MHKIQQEFHSTSNNEFTNGSPQQGVKSTIVDQTWLNTIQRELCNLVTGSGQTLSETNDAQVLEAVKRLGFNAVSLGANQDYNVNANGDGSVVIFKTSPRDFAFTNNIRKGSAVIVVPLWNSLSSEKITVSYREMYVDIPKYCAFIGYADESDDEFALIGYHVKLATSNNDSSFRNLSVEELTATKNIDNNLVSFAYDSSQEGLQDWQRWQLMENWKVGQVKRVYCTNAASSGTSIITFKDTAGTFHNVTFYPGSYREFICIGSHSEGNDYAVLLVNGKGTA